MEEIQRMGSLLGDKEACTPYPTVGIYYPSGRTPKRILQAGYWISSVGECSRSAEGQAELVQKGRAFSTSDTSGSYVHRRKRRVKFMPKVSWIHRSVM